MTNPTIMSVVPSISSWPCEGQAQDDVEQNSPRAASSRNLGFGQAIKMSLTFPGVTSLQDSSPGKAPRQGPVHG